MIDYTERFRLYSAFFVVRTACDGVHFHTDWADDVGTNAFTLMTPLADYPIAPNESGGQFQLLYRDYEHSFDSMGEDIAQGAGVHRYIYRKGEAIVFGSHFSHSTEPGRPAADAPQVYLCFTFGSDKAEHWPSVFASCGYQARVLAGPDGRLVEGILPNATTPLSNREPALCSTASDGRAADPTRDADPTAPHWLHSPERYLSICVTWASRRASSLPSRTSATRAMSASSAAASRRQLAAV